MEILNIIGILIGLLIIMIGVIMIYDARNNVEKYFSFHDKNEGAKWFKICGFLLVLVGILGVYFSY